MRKILSISSKDIDKNKYESNDFEIIFNKEQIKSLKLVSIVIPQSFYTIEDYNSTFNFNIGGSDYICALTKGRNYDTTELAVEIALQMNSIYLTDNLFTCNFIANTQKFLIAHGTATFKLITNNITLGFNKTQDQTLSLTQTSDSLVNLGYNETIFIKCNELSSNDYGIMYPVVCDKNFGEYITYNDIQNWGYEFERKKWIYKLNFQLLFEDKETLVPLNGMDWRITFLIE